MLQLSPDRCSLPWQEEEERREKQKFTVGDLQGRTGLPIFVVSNVAAGTCIMGLQLAVLDEANGPLAAGMTGKLAVSWSKKRSSKQVVIDEHGTIPVPDLEVRVLTPTTVLPTSMQERWLGYYRVCCQLHTANVSRDQASASIHMGTQCLEFACRRKEKLGKRSGLGCDSHQLAAALGMAWRRAYRFPSHRALPGSGSCGLWRAPRLQSTAVSLGTMLMFAVDSTLWSKPRPWMPMDAGK